MGSEQRKRNLKSSYHFGDALAPRRGRSGRSRCVHFFFVKLEAPGGQVSATLSSGRVPFSSPFQCEPVFGTRRSCLVSLLPPPSQLTPTTVLLQPTVKIFLGDSLFERKRIEILHQKWIVCAVMDSPSPLDVSSRCVCVCKFSVRTIPTFATPVTGLNSGLSFGIRLVSFSDS